MVTIIKKIKGKSYTITGKKEYNHQKGWQFEEPIVIKKGKTIIDNFTQKKSILSMIKSSDLELVNE
jgi:hypothetical protein